MLPTLTTIEPPHIQPIAIIEQVKQEPEKKTHTVIKGDNLTKLSEAYSVPLDRIWAANPQLQHPDQLNVNEQLKIPSNTDVLTPREMPSTVEVADGTVRKGPLQTSQPSAGSSVSGNTYAKGYCTWYVKNQLGWVRNGWGDAIRWKSNAQAQGFTVSATPTVGSVAWTKAYSHVSVVISIAGNSVAVREMNYKGRGVISTRVAPISEFLYIR